MIIIGLDWARSKHDYLLMAPTGEILQRKYLPRENCRVIVGRNGKEYYTLADSNNGAGILEWYQRRYAPEINTPALLKLADNVPSGCDGLMAIPLANQYPELEGFKNRSALHGHGHFVRAIMESTCSSLAGVLDNLCPEGRPRRIIATGGGAYSDIWLQMKADSLGIEVVRTACQEPACLSAAMLAAATCKWFDNVSGANQTWVKVQRVFSPDYSRHSESSG